ncbi:MAG: LysM peptidoglycan-binding domain-containing protein [Lachnospiraceae bacterium]|nr:LysM peptidoglycan-binding domain-containing protein [Lachnospiraceae bacterium]
MNTTVYQITNRELLNHRRKMRRQRILRRRIVFSILAVFLILIFSFSYNVLTTQANDDMEGVKYKYFTYHEVQKGETLWSIAENYIDYDFYDTIQDYIDELKDMNHINEDIIKVGEEIVITYYSSVYR